MGNNHAEKHCNLRQITLQSASSYDVIWVRKHGKVTEIAGWKDADEDIEAIKWLRTNGEMTSCKHGKHVFISIWWGRKVLKMRKEVDKN